MQRPWFVSDRGILLHVIPHLCLSTLFTSSLYCLAIKATQFPKNVFKKRTLGTNFAACAQANWEVFATPNVVNVCQCNSFLAQTCSPQHKDNITCIMSAVSWLVAGYVIGLLHVWSHVCSYYDSQARPTRVAQCVYSLLRAPLNKLLTNSIYLSFLQEEENYTKILSRVLVECSFKAGLGLSWLQKGVLLLRSLVSVQ